MNFDFAALNFVDYAIFGILIVSALLSTLRGMTREALGLVGWPISVLAAKFVAPVLEPAIHDAIGVDGLSQALAWSIPFAIVVVGWFIFASLISPGLKRAGLGALDRWLGVIFGVTRGFLLVLIAYTIAAITLEGEDNLPAAVGDAQFAPIMRSSATTMAVVFGDDIRDRILDNVPAQADDGTTLLDNIGAPVEEGTATVTDQLKLLEDESQ